MIFLEERDAGAGVDDVDDFVCISFGRPACSAGGFGNSRRTVQQIKKAA
jgi:hypothetical protein